MSIISGIRSLIKEIKEESRILRLIKKCTREFEKDVSFSMKESFNEINKDLDDTIKKNFK